MISNSSEILKQMELKIKVDDTYCIAVLIYIQDNRSKYYKIRLPGITKTQNVLVKFNNNNWVRNFFELEVFWCYSGCFSQESHFDKMHFEQLQLMRSFIKIHSG